MGYLATAVSSSLLRLTQDLYTVPVTTQRSLGRTSSEEGATRSFKGVLALPGDWKQAIQPGGVTSTTDVILVVSDNARDGFGSPLSLSKEDIVVAPDGRRYCITRLLETTAQYGVKIYELTEHYE